MPTIDNRFPKCYICGMNKYGLEEYSFEVGPVDDSSETVAIVGIEYSSVSEDEKFYRKEDIDNLLAGRDVENRKLKRALWLARAERYKISEFIAREEANLCNQISWSRILRERTYDQWVDQLLRIANLANKLHNKCLAKADEYRVEQFHDEGTSKC